MSEACDRVGQCVESCRPQPGDLLLWTTKRGWLLELVTSRDDRQLLAGLQASEAEPEPVVAPVGCRFATIIQENATVADFEAKRTELNETTNDPRIGKRRDEIEVKAGDLLVESAADSFWRVLLVQSAFTTGRLQVDSISSVWPNEKRHVVDNIEDAILIATNATLDDLRAEVARLASEQGETANPPEIPDSSEPSRIGQRMTRENARPGDLCEGVDGLALVVSLHELGRWNYSGLTASQDEDGEWDLDAGYYVFVGDETLIAENATPADFHARLEELKAKEAGKDAPAEDKPEVKFGQCWRLCGMDYWPMSWQGDRLWGLARHGCGTVCWEVYHYFSEKEPRKFEYLHDALPPGDFPGRPVMDSKMRYLPGAEEWIAAQEAKGEELKDAVDELVQFVGDHEEPEGDELDGYSQRQIDGFNQAGPGSAWTVTQYGDEEPTQRLFERISTKLKHPSAIFRDGSITCISSIANAELGWPINPADAKPGDILEVEFTWAKGTAEVEVFVIDKEGIVPLSTQNDTWIDPDEIKSCRLVSRKEPAMTDFRGRPIAVGDDCLSICPDTGNLSWVAITELQPAFNGCMVEAGEKKRFVPVEKLARVENE